MLRLLAFISLLFLLLFATVYFKDKLRQYYYLCIASLVFGFGAFGVFWYLGEESKKALKEDLINRFKAGESLICQGPLGEVSVSKETHNYEYATSAFLHKESKKITDLDYCK